MDPTLIDGDTKKVIIAVLLSPGLVNLIVAWVKDLYSTIFKKKLTKRGIRATKVLVASLLTYSVPLLTPERTPKEIGLAIVLWLVAYMGGGLSHDLLDRLGAPRAPDPDKTSS